MPSAAAVERQRLRCLRYYHEVVVPKKQRDPAFAERIKAAARRNTAAARRRRKVKHWSAAQRIAACQWRLHTLAPDGDLSALRERIQKECKQWST